MTLGAAPGARAAVVSQFPPPVASAPAQTLGSVSPALQAEAKSNALRRAHPGGVLCATAPVPGCHRGAKSLRGRLSPRAAWWGKPAPPPSPPLLGQPAFWTGTIVVIAIALALRFLSKKRRPLSKAELYFELSRSMMLKSPEELTSAGVSTSASVDAVAAKAPASEKHVDRKRKAPASLPPPSSTTASPAPARMHSAAVSPSGAPSPTAEAVPATAAAPAEAEEPAEEGKSVEENAAEEIKLADSEVKPAKEALTATPRGACPPPPVTPPPDVEVEVVTRSEEAKAADEAKPAEEDTPDEEAKPAEKAKLAEGATPSEEPKLAEEEKSVEEAKSVEETKPAQETKSKEAKPVEAAPPRAEKPAKAAPPELDVEEAKPAKKGAFAWLSRGQREVKAPSLRNLIAGGQASQGALREASVALARAVANKLAIDAPDGCFQDLPGLTAVPASVPKALRLTLLDTALSSEAEKLKAVERADVVFRVARSMFTELADRAAGLGGQQERVDALNNLVVLVKEASHMCAQLAPDVEPEQVTYAGGLSGKQLKGLYIDFVDSSVEDAQAATMAMLGGLMGGGGSAGNPEQLQARVEQSEELRDDLAKFLKIPEKESQKLMEKRAEKMAAKMQKDMLANLGNL